ncbi:MAG: hypothetical protein O3B73_00120 [bacterium]|nr:hypothetical protein [bacterium]
MTVPHAYDTMRHQTGVVVPVYFPEQIDRSRATALLRDTVFHYCTQVDDPAHICLSVDGAVHGEREVTDLAREFGVSTCVGASNRGKLSGAQQGVVHLLGNTDIRFIALVDQDGDHFANELLNFIRTARHIGLDRVLVLGNRLSRHRPMGFARGELEELADRLLLDALTYHAAQTGLPLRLEYANTLGEFPDFHSGYKVFSRRAAEDVFLSAPERAGCSETCYYRHACEAVMVVECLTRAGYLGVVNRRTFNEQPITTFGLYNRQQLIADKIIWPCKRLNIPAAFVKQWMDNHLPRLTLGTLVPDGKNELASIRKIVLDAFGVEDADGLTPLFV